MRAINIGLLILFLGLGEANANSRAVDAAEELIKSQFGVDSSSISVTMRENVSFSDLQPQDEIRVYSQTSSLPHGVCVFRFDIVRDGIVVKSISAPVNVSIWQLAYISRKEIKRGIRIRSGDISVERCEVTNCLDRFKQ